MPRATLLVLTVPLLGCPPSPQLPQLDIVVSARSLARQGYRYIVVHTDLYPFFKQRQIEAVLTGAIGEPVAWPEDGLLVYRLEPIAPAVLE